MVKVIKQQETTAYTSLSWWQIAIIGALTGILYVILTLVIQQTIVDPLLCRSVSDANACSNSIGVSGNIATVLVATISLIGLIRFRVPRPIIVAVATAIVLFGLSNWTNGLAWPEVVAWSLALYALSYSLFAWISRYSRAVPVIIATVIIVVLIRIIPTL